jgi:hypothetical protein
MKTISNLNASLTSWLNYLRGLYSMVRSLCSSTSQHSQSVHVSDTYRNIMDDIRIGMATLLRSNEDDDASTIAVKNAMTRLWFKGKIPQLIDLTADGVVTYYKEVVLPEWEDSGLMEHELNQLDCLAVFMRTTSMVKKMYYEHGWLDDSHSSSRAIMSWLELGRQVERHASFLDYYRDELDAHGKWELEKFEKVYEFIRQINVGDETD